MVVYNQILKDWDELPDFMKVPEVRPYWEMLYRRRGQLKFKRAFDVVVSTVMIIFLLIPMLVISIAVELGSPGPVLYRQIRVTQYGRKFKINKFRTMYDWTGHGKDGKKEGPSVTVANDRRITKVGAVLRKYRLDEFPQIFNVLLGDMSFVGTRPEVPKYVEKYEDEWNATLLLPAGITSECSIRYKNENKLLDGVSGGGVDKVYMEQVLPEKMDINLKSVEQFGVFDELVTLFRTVAVVVGKEYQ